MFIYLFVGIMLGLLVGWFIGDLIISWRRKKGSARMRAEWTEFLRELEEHEYDV